jgi:hypothetical protein
MPTDIFDAYAKLAIERGLIKLSSEENKESKELKKFKSDVAPRAGSDTIEVIEKLYGNKPDAPKSQQYKKNVFEVAHPEKVILNPAYDRMNALIENPNERQRIMLNIVHKPVNGQLTQHRYAAQALTQSLIAIANDLDNRNIEPLRKLADECIADLHKQAFEFSDIGNWLSKEFENTKDVGEGAIGGSTIGAIAGGLIGAFGGPVGIAEGAWLGTKAGGLLGGLLASIFNTGPQAKSVALNAKEAQERLSDLLKDHQGDLFLTSLDNALAQIIETASVYGQIVDQMHLKSDDQGQKNEARLAALQYQKELNDLDRLIKIFLANANMGRYAPEESDTWGKIKSPFTAIFGDKVHDAVQSFETLDEVTKDAVKGVAVVLGQAADAKAASQAAPPAATPTPTTTPVAPGSAPAPNPLANWSQDQIQALLKAIQEQTGK